jgi:hypothetical protein
MFDTAFNNGDCSFSLFSDKVKLVLEVLHDLLHLGTNHVMEQCLILCQLFFGVLGLAKLFTTLLFDLFVVFPWIWLAWHVWISVKLSQLASQLFKEVRVFLRFFTKSQHI